MPCPSGFGFRRLRITARTIQQVELQFRRKCPEGACVRTGVEAQAKAVPVISRTMLALCCSQLANADLSGGSCTATLEDSDSLCCACCASCSTEAVRELHTKLADADVRDCADLPRIIFGLAVVAPGSAVILMLLAPPGNWPAVRLWSTATLSTSHRRTTRQLRECLTFFTLREVYRAGDYRHS